MLVFMLIFSSGLVRKKANCVPFRLFENTRGIHCTGRLRINRYFVELFDTFYYLYDNAT